jgi:hypothetical protein
MANGKPKGPNKNSDSQLKEGNEEEKVAIVSPFEKIVNPIIIEKLNNFSNSVCPEHDESPKAKTIHVIMRPDPEGFAKLSEIERKNIKKQFLNVF